MIDPTRRNVIKELTNLKVQRVDLVSRAAVRNPDNPDEPTTFLVWKSEDAPTDVLARKEPTTPATSGGPTPTSNRAYAEIQRLAQVSKSEGETFEQAVARVSAQRPDLVRAYRAADQPVLKSSAGRDIAMDRIEALAKREELRNPALTHEQAIAAASRTTEGREAYRSYRAAADAAKEPISKRDDAKEAALSRLNFDINQTMRQQHLSRAAATSQVLKSESGARDFRILKGDPARERARLPVTKSSGYFQQLLDVASVIRKSDPTLTPQQALVRATQTAPDIARNYNDAMRREIAGE